MRLRFATTRETGTRPLSKFYIGGSAFGRRSASRRAIRLSISPLFTPENGTNRKTDLPVRSTANAIGKLRWYAILWKIEVFQNILKSGCKAEEARLRPAKRLLHPGLASFLDHDHRATPGRNWRSQPSR